MSEFRRIAYGDEPQDWGADYQPCHDCKVQKGELHIPGCDVERCPLCSGQAISCGCLWPGETPDEDDNDWCGEHAPKEAAA